MPQTESYTAAKGYIASMVLFLCSDKAGFITGENISINGGMTKQIIYHAEHGWTLTNKFISWTLNK